MKKTVGLIIGIVLAACIIFTGCANQNAASPSPSASMSLYPSGSATVTASPSVVPSASASLPLTPSASGSVPASAS